MRDGMQVIRIREAGRYNDGDGKAHNLQAGDELETHAWYAQALVAEGLAEWPVMSATEAVALADAGGSQFAGVVPAGVVAEMAKRGIRTLAELAERSDEELLKIPGLGTGRLKKLRAMVDG